MVDLQHSLHRALKVNHNQKELIEKPFSFLSLTTLGYGIYREYVTWPSQFC
jgi:hypothetical protein